MIMESPLQELKASRRRLIEEFKAGELKSAFHSEYTEMVDQYLRRAVQESAVGQMLFHRNVPFAFVAVGGYGRKELCVRSDIDVILLFRRAIPTEAKGLMQETLWPLWDAGLDVGYGTRTIKDCTALSKEDFSVLTSILDARLVCGDSHLYLELLGQIRAKALGRRLRGSFKQWLNDSSSLRMKLYGDATYLLEPNLKEGIGGLRDYHCILWASKVFLGLVQPRDLEYQGVLSHQEYLELQECLSLILHVRNRLHMLSGRKNDRLIMEYQEDIAGSMGYRKRNGLQAVEAFLGDLHYSMGTIKSLWLSFRDAFVSKGKKRIRSRKTIKGLKIVDGELFFSSPEHVLSKPELMFDIFVESTGKRIPISTEARRLIREFLMLVDDEFRSSQRSTQAFLEILKAPAAYEALEAMLETGFLGAYLPEFRRIQDRVQFDTYHVYPVGRHLLETFRKIKSIRKEGEIILTTVLSEIRHPERLILAALLHDIGKTGRNHSKRGSAITKEILLRLGLDRETIEDVAFLVRYHLLLAETATRRDLEDEKVIFQCARQIGSIDRLKMLYLLTWADSKATGPKAWNDWTASLVQELFFKVLHIFAQKELATEDAAKRIKKTRAAVSRQLGSTLGKDRIKEYFDIMSPRYLLNMPASKISNHIVLADRFADEFKREGDAAFMLEAVQLEAEKCWELTFVGKDRPGLFSDIAGAMAINNLNILSARIHTWSDGTVVDIFHVTPPLDPLKPEKTWQKMRKTLEGAFKGKISIAEKLASKDKPSIARRKYASKREPQVIIDNEASDFFTIVEVFANDRLGILYTITKTLFELGLDIRIAKISTKVDQIADVFYVRDQFGQKVTDQESLHKIKTALMGHMGG